MVHRDSWIRNAQITCNSKTIKIYFIQYDVIHVLMYTVYLYSISYYRYKGTVINYRSNNEKLRMSEHEQFSNRLSSYKIYGTGKLHFCKKPILKMLVLYLILDSGDF